MSDLVDFLLAAIAEDERIATSTTPVPERRLWVVGELGGDAAVERAAGEGMVNDFVAREMWDKDAEHVSRWDPARVLAECEAKRRILELHRDLVDLDDRATLRYLALPYADREGYREEWRP